MSLHAVNQGECLSSIADSYGFLDWQIIYGDPANSDLRTQRPDPNVLYPGDVVYIPDRDSGGVECQTDATHRFVLKTKPTYVNVCLQDPGKRPIKNAPYKLRLGSVELEGTTDGDGWVRRKIQASAEYGTLLVWPDPEDRTELVVWQVLLGHLDPLETTTEAKARLKNLGYYDGEIDDSEDDAYDSAVRQFQQDHGLVVDGIVGPKTRAQLKQQHRN